MTKRLVTIKTYNNMPKLQDPLFILITKNKCG